ncbi:secretion protein Por [Chryseobacterium pennae]|uniref:Secretion protein Por n=1 Tax=Chryseobacterium pennae TaxID=2258962 RepID=A0A3D9C161_9FLAO|nr:S8 family peptidase [Chryseobacterium pennae]REC59605.1 secretion protein Por [Chryseobacterium pennae]
MKKIFISISTMIISLAGAQQSNEKLMKEFEKQRVENNKKFDARTGRQTRNEKSNNPLEKVLLDLKEQKSSLAGFTPSGIPLYYSSQDSRQPKNSNADHLQNGTITGLQGSFNGENIKYTIFDGGRVLETHQLFNNLTNRISNKENADSVKYHFHSTAVAGFIGAKNYNFTGSWTNNAGVVVAQFTNLNLQGVAQNSTMDSYSYDETTLPGNTTRSTVYQKILLSEPRISNHSYGVPQGWWQNPSNGAWYWRGTFTSPATATSLEGTYQENDREYDKIVYSNPTYIIVKSAGNSFGDQPEADDFKLYPNPNFNPDLPSSSSNPYWAFFEDTDTLPLQNCSNGYDCIGSGSLAKNIIVVGANDIITANEGRYATSTDVVHSSYSSAGPRDDGGIKPDITATGTNVVSASVKTNNQPTYEYGSGTSYSGPIVTGIIGLWNQINKQLFENTQLNAASAKTLMIHSALEAGNVGPDPWYGWGLIDAKKGAELLVGKSNNSVIFNNETLNSGIPNTKTVTALGMEPLKVTISWIDPAFTNLPATDLAGYNDRTSRLINDLDLRIIDTETNTTYLPWKLNANNPMTTATNGDNTVDNVEQIVINTPIAGKNYKIEISNKGTLVNDNGTAAPQNYSIIITGHNGNTLGTKESKAGVLSSVTVAPSVTKDLTNILKAPQKSTYSIYDLSGKKLREGSISSDKESIDLSSYTKGIYIIEVKTGKDIISKKIIKE